MAPGPPLPVNGAECCLFLVITAAIQLPLPHRRGNTAPASGRSLVGNRHEQPASVTLTRLSSKKSSDASGAGSSDDDAGGSSATGSVSPSPRLVAAGQDVDDGPGWLRVR
jgi:hypothetical protein